MNEKDLMSKTENIYKSIPPLSVSVREAIVTYAPWLALLFGILGLMVGIAGLGLMSILSPLIMLGGGVHVGIAGFIAAIIALITSILLLLAFPLLKARKMGGWRWLFWSEAISILGSVLSLQPLGVVMGLVVFYFIFQIKSYYR